MGIRFACHVCEKPLNIKHELAGKRGICPGCSAKFRIPTKDAKTSSPLEQAKTQPQTKTPAVTRETGVSVKEAPAAKPAAEQDLLADDPEATWYVRPPSGGQYGPADSNVLRQWIAEGRVAATSLLWRDGWPNWRPADEVLPGVADKSSQAKPNPGISNAVPQDSGSKDSSQAQTPEPPRTSEVQGTQASGNPGSLSSDRATSVGVAPALAGPSDVGTHRRQRNGKRIFWIGALAAIALALLGVLMYLMFGS